MPIWQEKEKCQSLDNIYLCLGPTGANREEIFLILTDVSGIQRLRVSDLGEKLTIPIQLKSVRMTQATMVTSGCKATWNIIFILISDNIYHIHK